MSSSTFSYRRSKKRKDEFVDFVKKQCVDGLISVQQGYKRGVDTLRRVSSFETSWFEAFFAEKQRPALKQSYHRKKPTYFSPEQCKLCTTCHPHSIKAICCGLVEYSISIRSTRHGLWAKERVFYHSSSLCYNDKHICLKVILNTRHFCHVKKQALGRLIATREVYICRELVVWKKAWAEGRLGNEGTQLCLPVTWGLGFEMTGWMRLGSNGDARMKALVDSGWKSKGLKYEVSNWGLLDCR